MGAESFIIIIRESSLSFIQIVYTERLKNYILKQLLSERSIIFTQTFHIHCENFTEICQISQFFFVSPLISE